MTAVRFCPSCGAARIEGARFCGGCGADLAAPGVPTVPISPDTEPQVPPVAQVPPPLPSVARSAAVATTPVAGRSTPGDSRPARDEPPTRRRRSLMLVGLLLFLAIAAGIGVGAVVLLRPSSAPGQVADSPFATPIALTSPSASQIPEGPPTSPSAGLGGWSWEVTFKDPLVSGAQVKDVLAAQGYPDATVTPTSDGYLRIWNGVAIEPIAPAVRALEAALGPISAQRAVPTTQPGSTPAPSGGHVQVEYQVLPVGDRQPDAGALSTTKLILENRLRAIGVADAIVETFGTDRVVVILPFGGDLASIRALLVTTGKLDFVPLPTDKYGKQGAVGTYQAVDGQALPTTETPLFGGEQIDQAYPATDATGGRAVGFRLKSDGSRLFGDYTTKHVGEFFAIVLDNKVVSAPVIQSAITSGLGIISGGSAGGFAAKEMNSLITVLNYGSLPFPLKEESFQPVAAPDSASTAP